MSIGKYVTNFGVISGIIGGFSTQKQTQAMPKDWRRFIVWGVWAAGLLLTIAGVAKQIEDGRFEEEQREQLQLLKAEAKEAKLQAKLAAQQARSGKR